MPVKSKSLVTGRSITLTTPAEFFDHFARPTPTEQLRADLEVVAQARDSQRYGGVR